MYDFFSILDIIYYSPAYIEVLADQHEIKEDQTTTLKYWGNKTKAHFGPLTQEKRLWKTILNNAGTMPRAK